MVVTTRTYGWIQNPSNFSKLKKTVQIFDSQSQHYLNLKDTLIKDLIYFKDLKSKLQNKFDKNITIFSYQELVGSSRDKNNRSPKKRKDAVANGLIQISLIPQNHKRTGKRYSDDWTSDGFLRWAVSLNFLKPNRKDDTYEITTKGLVLSRSLSEVEDIEILRDAFLSYPPATRILYLLSESNVPRNKFYLGSRLGFQGEKGFTSYNEKIMEEWLLSTTDAKELTNIRNNIEGTSDKYARMICNWLIKVGFVKRRTIKINGITSFIGFQISGKGIHAYRQSIGYSSNTVQPKFLKWEFLAVEETNRDYVRTRRAYILKNLKRKISMKELLENLKEKGFSDDEEIIKNDLKGFKYTGLRIDDSNDSLILKDIINDFEIPITYVTPEIESIEKDKKIAYFLKNTNLDIRHIELLDIAFDSKRNRDFEIITTELINEVYGLDSIHLGGGRKPDGISYTKDYGIIYDTKAYNKGYGKSISEADKMIRYIEDNKQRSLERNETEWWVPFPKLIKEDKYFFLWISSKYIGSFTSQLDYVSLATGYKGAGITIEALLLGADMVSKNELLLKDIPSYFNNSIISNKKQKI